jgi:hypothetical protein
VVYFLTEVRVIIVPLALCFAPLVSNWAVWFAQFLIPIAKFHSRALETKKKARHSIEDNTYLIEAARYWVLHLCVASVLTCLLPMNGLRFITWWYLSWPSTIQWLWNWCGRELVVALDVVLGEAPLTDLSIARALEGLVQRLPRKKSIPDESIGTRSGNDGTTTAYPPVNQAERPSG